LFEGGISAIDFMSDVDESKEGVRNVRLGGEGRREEAACFGFWTELKQHISFFHRGRSTT